MGSEPSLPCSPKQADRPGNPGGSTLPGDPGWVRNSASRARQSIQTAPEIRVGRPFQEILVGFTTAPPALAKASRLPRKSGWVNPSRRSWLGVGSAPPALAEASRPPRKSGWVDPSRRSWLGLKPRPLPSPKRADRPGNPGGSALPGDPGWTGARATPQHHLHSQTRANRPGNPGWLTLPGDPGRAEVVWVEGGDR